MSKRQNKTKKIDKDFYPTPYKATLPLTKLIDTNFTFVEPCAGDGRLVEHLEKQGAKCLAAYDIEPRRDWVLPLDAREFWYGELHDADYIITNPPWTNTKEGGYLLNTLIETFAELAPTWLLFYSDWANNVSSSELLTKYCEKILPIGRVSWFENGVGGFDNCSWYFFDKNKTEGVYFIPRLKI